MKAITVKKISTGFLFATLCWLPVFPLPPPLFSAELLMVTIEHPPNNFIQNGEVTGANTEMLRHVLTQMGHTPKFLLVPTKRALKMVEDGDAAGIYTYTQAPERLKAAYVSNPVAFISTVFFKRKSDNIQWNVLSDLHGYKIGGTGAYNYPKTFMDAVEKGELAIEYIFGENSNAQNLKKLVSGRIGLFICNPDVCGFTIKAHAPEFDGIDYIDKSVGPVKSFHVGFSKKLANGKQIRDEFNEKFDEILANGLLKQIYDKYGMKPDYDKLGSNGISFLENGAQ